MYTYNYHIIIYTYVYSIQLHLVLCIIQFRQIQGVQTEFKSANKKNKSVGNKPVAWTHEILVVISPTSKVSDLQQYVFWLPKLIDLLDDWMKEKMIQFWLFRMLGQKEIFDFWTFIQLFNKIEIINGNLYDTFGLLGFPWCLFNAT